MTNIEGRLKKLEERVIPEKEGLGKRLVKLWAQIRSGEATPNKPMKDPGEGTTELGRRLKRAYERLRNYTQ